MLGKKKQKIKKQQKKKTQQKTKTNKKTEHKYERFEFDF